MSRLEIAWMTFPLALDNWFPSIFCIILYVLYAAAYIYIRLRMCSYACVCIYIYIYACVCKYCNANESLPAQCHQQAQSWPSQVVCQTRFGSWRFTFQRRPCLIAPALGVATWWGSIPGRVTEKRGTEKGVGDTKKKNDKRGSSGWNTSTVGFYS